MKLKAFIKLQCVRILTSLQNISGIVYFKYFIYLLRHKWFVFVGCVSFGLIWRGITHDLDKFSPRSFFAYARYYPINDDIGYLKLHNIKNLDLEAAWFKHTRKSDHHWQHWTIHTEDYKELFTMSPNSIKEMICNWISIERIKGNSNVRKWWNENKINMKFNQETLLAIETHIGEIEKWKITKNQQLDAE